MSQHFLADNSYAYPVQPNAKTNRPWPGGTIVLYPIPDEVTRLPAPTGKGRKGVADELLIRLNERQIGFRSITKQIDTTTSGGKVVFHISGALAEFERDLIRERTSAGLAAAGARGCNGGRRRLLDNP